MGLATWLRLVVIFGLLGPASALAQDDEGFGDESGGESGEEAGDEGGFDETDVDLGTDEPPEEALEKPGSRVWDFGLYARYAYVPGFFLKFFLDAAPGVGSPGFGISALYHGEGEGAAFYLGLGYTSYSFEDPFRISGDPLGDTEWLESDLGILEVTGSILWKSEFTKELTFFYGVGLELGVVTGELVRSEATNASGKWQKCTTWSPLDTQFCEPPTGNLATNKYDEDGAHYGVVEERVPPVVPIPMLPHLLLDYSPIPDLALRAEMAFGLAQLWFGVSAGYSPKL
ncbi:MAG: hypothetical protein OEZ06_10365 [Myxococcales bacterium]|nr:hypothetical protein [Myxococcales bacterium]